MEQIYDILISKRMKAKRERLMVEANPSPDIGEEVREQSGEERRMGSCWI